MEDLERYLDEIVDPTIKDLEENPTSVRHAFLACVATFHGVDYLAFPRKGRSVRERFRKESIDFALIDQVAHAFKHVVAGDSAKPKLRSDAVISRPPAYFGAAVWNLSRWNDTSGGVTLDKNREIDLLDVVKRAARLLRKQINSPLPATLAANES